jgi:hypothetical protein
MAEIKKISTELQLLDKFLDTSGDAGTSGQILSSTGTGINWVSGGSLPGGPYLPLSAGSSYPLTGDLYLATASNEGNLFFGTSSASYKIFGGGTYGYMGYDTGGYHRFLTSGSEKMRITSGGDLCLGVTSALGKIHMHNSGTSYLHISNSTTGSSAGSGTDIGVFTGQSDLQINNREAASVIISTSDTPRLTINSSGNVGINCTPSYKLQWSDGTRTGLLDTNVGAVVIGSVSNDALALYTNLTEKMRITSAGNVGIGTTTPQDLLEVRAADGVTGVIRVQGGKNAVTSIGEVNSRLDFGSNDGSVASPFVGGRIASVTELNNGARTGLAFSTYLQSRPGDDLMEFVRITSEGNVGIGTSTPADKLEVYNNGGDVAIRIHEDAGTHEALLHLRRGGSDWELINNSDFAIESENSEKFRITTAGNVGIGTTSPNVSGVGSESVVLSVIETSGNRRGILELGDNQNADTGGIGSINFVGHYQNAGHKIMAEIRASGSGATSGQRGSFIGMFTKENGAAAIAERMRISSTGSVKFNAYNGTNNTGSPTHILGTDANGLIVKSTAGSSIGPWLPLAAGSGDPLTGDLYINKSAPALRLNDSGDNVPYELRVDGTTFSIKEVTNSRTLMSMTAGAVITLDSLGSNTVINTTGAMVVPNGKVGIGTTLPDAPLHILKAAGGANIVTALKLDPDDATAGSGVSIDFNASTTNTGASLVGSRIVGARQGGNASGFLALYTSPDASGSVPLERMRINSSGNVGIGTNSPNDKLNIHNSSANANLGIKITRGSQTHGLRLGVNDSHAFLWTDQNQDLVFATNDSQRVTIKAGGNVGIGTTSPVAKLHVEGTGDLVRLVSTNAGSAGAQMDMLQFSASPADDDVMGLINMGGYYSGTNSAYFSSIRTIATDVSARKGALSFLTRSGNDFTEKMHITSSADANKAVVAIGITPSNWYNYTALQVGTGSLQSPSSSTITLGCNYYVDSGVSTTETYITNGSATAYQQGSGTHAWYTAPSGTAGNGVTFTERMRITNTGNVGIGTTSPDSKLEVDMNDASGNRLGFTGDGSTTGAALWTNWTTGASYLDFRLGGITDTYTKMRITSAGNVGIGTTSPTGYRLVVENTSEDLLKLHNSTDGLDALISFTNPGGTLGRIQGIANGGLGFDVGNNAGGINTNAMFISNLGKVGIGTTSLAADSILTIATTASTGLTLLSVSNAGESFLNFADTADVNAGRIYYGHGDNAMRFRTNDGLRMIIDSSGNVGIGTTSPSRELDIQASSGWAEIALRGNTGAGGSLEFWTNTTKRAEIFADTEDIVFRNTATNQERMRISAAGAIKFNAYGAGTLVTDASGNITAATSGAGTGTVTSITKGNGLVVAGSPITTTGSVAVEYAGNVNNIITGGNNYIGDTAVLTDQILITDPGATTTSRRVGNIELGDLPFLPFSGGTMTGDLTVTADVGIGLTGPDVPLHVTASEDGSGIDKGTAKFINTATGSGATTMHIVQTTASSFGNAIKFWQGSTPTAVGFIRLTSSATQFITSASDLNLKKNITTWGDDTLSKFKALEPKKFRFKTQDTSEDKTLGFIAQNEVGNFPEAYPQFLGEDEKPYYGFNPTGMVPHLMKAIKDLVEKVETLENKITQLENNN